MAGGPSPEPDWRKSMDLTVDDGRRTFLAALAFLAGGAVPIQLVTLSFGYAQYLHSVPKGKQAIALAHEFAAMYLPFIYLPALVILAGIALYSKTNYPELYRRIVVGFGAGLVATIGLDTLRQMGVIYGWLPSDTPMLFGKMVTGGAPFTVTLSAGLVVHYLNGANFGLFYAFVWGKRSSYRSAVLWSLGWLTIVEVGMMTLPPMAPMVGPFGIMYAWPELFLITLGAHWLFAIVLGLLVQTFLTREDRGWLVPFLVGTQRTEPAPASDDWTSHSRGSND
jgi:hypothetical protein